MSSVKLVVQPLGNEGYGNYEAFMAEYHCRSNVESTNSAVKMTESGKIRTKGFVAQVNESLALLVAYNLRVRWTRNFGQVAK